jgi:hypothetical protein
MTPHSVPAYALGRFSGDTLIFRRLKDKRHDGFARL